MEHANFKHDCLGCVFLGKYKDYDLYYCDQHGDPTVLARYGDKGYQYMSGMAFAHEQGTDHLHEAKKRAIAKGFYKGK